MNCEGCKYWVKQSHLLNEQGASSADGMNCGECHRYSPHHQPARGGMFRVWPVTVAKDWCGEFSQRAIEVAAVTETVSIAAPAVIVEAEAPKRRGRPPKNSEQV